MYPSDLPESIAGFAPTEELGRGAFGSVYRARHGALDIDVAVKLIDVHRIAGDADKVLREARLMARLDHPNLLRVLDAGLTAGSVYLVLELMDGGSCKGLRTLPPAYALDLARQLLSGVQALHDARILHRDIKPANCLRRARDGRVKLADLGVAAEWQTGAGYDRSGTLPYMAPELFDDAPKVGPSTDLYALGMTLACLLLPGDPFPPGPFDAVVEWVKRGPRPRLADLRPDLPTGLAALVDRMIARNVDDRPSSAAAALAALAGIDAPASAPVSPSSAGVASTAPLQETAHAADRIGMWVLGERVHESVNWLGHMANHAHTGQAARVMHLQPHGPIGGTSNAVLAAADRASRLSHRGFTEVVDWGMHDGQAFVVTAAQGQSLRDIVDGGRPLDEAAAVAFMAELADALAHLHAAGLVYQLVEPGSAVLRGDVQSVQFGWPMFCMPVGTPIAAVDGVSPRFYMPLFAPIEALAGRDTDTIEPTADMYGLGASFYYLLAGRESYSRVSALADARGAIRAALPALNARLARLLADLLKPNPRERPTAVQARAELGTIARQLGIPLL